MKVWNICVLMLMGATLRAELLNARYYWELCDASAAVALDEKHFAVADDEGSALRVYERDTPRPVREYEVGKFLTGEKKEETDVEGAARIGDRVYWISSHGRNKDGEDAPKRRNFFATDIVGKKGLKLEPVGKSYKNLLTDVLADKRFDRFHLGHASMLASKDRGGLNIEGMCAREDGALLIAFRSPVPNGKALALPLLNPAEVIQATPAKFGEMIELNLDGFGIRDIARAGKQYVIVAGARERDKKEFRLFVWDGISKTRMLPGADFDKLNPEVIFQFPDARPGVFQIFSDDGGRNVGGGRECKDLPKADRRFRAGELQVPILP